MIQRVLFSLCALALGSLAFSQTVYRYTDAQGRTVYSDQPPPRGARNVTVPNIQGNSIQNNPESLATQAAESKSPVTVYVTECGLPCDQAKAYINRRGVPHTLVDPTRTPELNERFKKETGGSSVPAIKIGERVLRGFNETSWAQALDQAGYPKTPSSFGPTRVREDRAGMDPVPNRDARAIERPGNTTAPR